MAPTKPSAAILMPSAPARLQVRNLQTACHGPYSLNIDSGECVTLMGKSGSGKSVLLRLIADLDPHTGGGVTLDGRQRESYGAPEWRRRVLYQSAEPAWWAPSVAAHFDAGQWARVADLCDALGLPEGVAHREVVLLSTGERQRLALLRSLSRAPDVLLLDEPTAALDGATTLAYEAVLRRQMEDGLAVLWVTHADEQALRIGSRRLEISEGRLLGS